MVLLLYFGSQLFLRYGVWRFTLDPHLTKRTIMLLGLRNQTNIIMKRFACITCIAIKLQYIIIISFSFMMGIPSTCRITNTISQCHNFIQDKSSGIKLEKTKKPATDATVSALNDQHLKTARVLFDQSEDQSLACSTWSVPSMIDNQTDLLSLAPSNQSSSSTSAPVRMTGHRNQPIDVSRFACLKCLKGCKDPLVAATKVRKATLRDFSVVEGKAAKAIDICKDVLASMRDDFDTEDRIHTFLAGYYDII